MLKKSNILQLIFLLCLLSWHSSYKAETIDTGNVLDPADEWTLKDKASIEECDYSGTIETGEVCTGNSLKTEGILGGGSILSHQDSLINQGLSVTEIQQGFDFQYGATIESHSSNLTVPTCSDNTYDCKDYFTITLNLTKSDGSLIQTYEHTVEMNYEGQKDYLYKQSIGQNNYQDVLYQMGIWSIDAGYYEDSFYGGIISQPHLSFQYNTINIINNIIIDVVDDIIKDNILLDNAQLDIVMEDIYTNNVSFEMSFNDILVDEPMIEPIAVMEELPEIQEIETQIEEQMEIDIQEPEQEPEQEVEEPSEEAIEEAEPEQKTISEKEIKEKIADKIMAAQPNKSSSQAQATQIALMVVLSDIDFSALSNTQINDIDFYDNLSFYEAKSMIKDNGFNVIGYKDYLTINEMVDNQWQN